MRDFLRKTIQGLALALPLIVTLWVIVWLLLGAEGFFSWPLEQLLGKSDKEPGLLRLEGIHYWHGMGLVLGIILTVAVGLLARSWLAAKSLPWFERLIGRIPLLKTLYSSVRDLLGFMSGSGRKPFSRVVLVKLSGTQAKVLGFVTRENFDDISGLKDVGDRIAVFISWSYNLGGVTLLVPREDIEEINMRVEDALRFALTAGVSVKDEALPAPPAGPPDDA